MGALAAELSHHSSWYLSPSLPRCWQSPSLSLRQTPRRTPGCFTEVTTATWATTDTPMLTTDTTARGLLNPSPSPPPLPSPTLTPRRTPGCCTVTATATATPTMATATARGPPSQNPPPTPRPIPRLTPTCFTVDTTDIPTLTGATTDILTSTANRSKSDNSSLQPPPSALPGGAS